MARRLPNLNALRAFEAAARLQSFTLAAAELNVTHAAISRHIRELEARLSAKLFHRTGRGVDLTEAGAALGRDLTGAFDLIAEATSGFSSKRDRRQLVISAEVAIADLWLVPRLGRFTAAHPEIDLVIDPANHLVDFAKNEADLGIRYGRGDWPGVAALKLADADLSPVCAPELIARSKVAEPADLAKLTLLQEEPKQHWRDWLEAAGVADRVVPSGATLKGHLAIAAAEAGQGVALADELQAADALRAGRLVRPFAVSVRHHGYYLVRGAGLKETPAAAAFGTWLRGEVAATLAEAAEPSRRAARPRRKAKSGA